MKTNLSFLVIALSSMSFVAMTAKAQTTATERAQAFVCAAKGKCFLPYDSREVQHALADITDIESNCRTTTKGVVSVPDRIGFANAKLDIYQNLMVLMLDFKPIARKQCASFSIDAMLNVYVLERNQGATHADTVAALLADPKPLLKKWKGKRAR